MLYLYVVQKCWLDGPRYEPALDCQRLWTSLEAAQQFAHGSAVKYSEAVASNKGNYYNINSNNNNNNTSIIATPKPVRTLLLNNSMFGFATSGRLFWVRRVSIPACECLRNNNNNNNSSCANNIPSTALVRLHQGVLGSSANHQGSRRGAEDVENCARLDCPNRCLQPWLQAQLSNYHACTWRRIPVGNNTTITAARGATEWWKEWSDWESWGKSTTTATSSGSASARNEEVVMMQDSSSLFQLGTGGGTGTTSKRRWIEQDVVSNDSSEDDELMGDCSGGSSSGDEHVTAAGSFFFSNSPNKKRVFTVPHY